MVINLHLSIISDTISSATMIFQDDSMHVFNESNCVQNGDVPMSESLGGAIQRLWADETVQSFYSKPKRFMLPDSTE